jgi:hypothetical protein
VAGEFSTSHCVGEESEDSRFVLLLRCPMKIDVSGVGHEPDFFGISRALNKHSCIAGSRVPVFLATDDEHRGLEIADVVDGTQLR